MNIRTHNRPRLSIRDLIGEAFAGLLQRPGRTAMTGLGTVLGIGAFVAVVGLTATTAGQIDSRFTALAATEVTVKDIGSSNPADTTMSFPQDSAARIEALNGVVHAGVWWPVPVRNPVIAAAPGVDGIGAGLAVLAMEPSAIEVIHPRMQTGRLFNEFHQQRAERVAILGSAAARRLGISRLDGQPAVFVNGVPFTVTGIIADVSRRPDTLLSIILPTTTALQSYGPPDSRAEMIIETRLGAAGLVASQAALALRPDAPQRFKPLAPPDPQTLRGSVTSDIARLFVILAAVSLIIGAVGIANTTLVSVMERVNEIGLRRCLGAARRHIAFQFLAESTAIGLVGGLVGSSLGVAAVVGVALAQRWTAILPPWTVLAAPLVGALIGIFAGCYPAFRATRIEPLEALR